MAVGIILALAGGTLLLVAALGHAAIVGADQGAPPRGWERFDLQLKSSARSVPVLLQAAKGSLSGHAGKRETMDALYSVVIDRFTHQEARHSFFGNWILFLLGKLDPAFSHVWDPGLMVARGHSLLCDQASYLLLDLALTEGIGARHVGLNGHVVMEAWYEGDWHMYDPDLEVVPVGLDGRVLSVEQLATDPGLLEKYYGRHGVAEIVASRENNTYVSYPVGARFEWKANLLAHFECWMEMGKFVFPALFILLGAGLLASPRARSPH